MFIILPMAVEIAKKERMARLKSKLEKGEPLTVGSLSHGGGVLSHAIHTGMADAGLKTRLSFANEIRPELLEQAHDFNDAWDSNTIPLAAPMQELAFDAWAMNHLPKVEVIEAGIPCSGASVSGRAKNGAGHAEAHPEVGHLIVPFLAIIAKVQPLCVVLENVKQWQNTASMCIFRNTLRDFGYTVHETVLKGSEWNELENRERLCVLAVSEGLDLDFANLHKPDPIVRKIGEILDPIKDDDESWDEMAYLKRKQQSDIEKGSNFMMQIVTSESTSCPTLTKGFAKRRSTDPKLAHPTNPDLLRQFTPGEHARLKGAPEKLVEGLGVTIAHEILGQSVCYGPFRAVGRLVAETLISGRLASDTIERIAKASQRDLLQEVQSGELSEA